MTLGREKGEVRCLTIDKRVAIPECIGKWYSKRLVLTMPEGRHTGPEIITCHGLRETG